MENIMLVILKVFLVVETVKKDLFSSRGKIKANNNNNDNKENIDINIHNSLRDNRQNNRILYFSNFITIIQKVQKMRRLSIFREYNKYPLNINNSIIGR